jgi:murein DD-endopeptidase MepM/ murein hydrolase activator NlpD
LDQESSRRQSAGFIRVAGRLAATAVLLLAIHPLQAAADTSKAAMFVPMLRPATPLLESAGAATTKVASPAVTMRDALAARQVAVTLGAGDTLLTVLGRQGISAAEAYRDLVKLRGRVNLMSLRPGDKLTLAILDDGQGKHLAALTWRDVRGRSASIALLPGAPLGLAAATPATAPAAVKPAARTANSDQTVVLKSATVRATPALGRLLTESNLPPQLCEQIVMALHQAKRPPRNGETVKIVYQTPKDPRAGSPVQLRYATYTGRDGRQHVYQYTPLPTPAPLQKVDIDAATMVALDEPLPGARISSPYGWRIHPVFHVTRFHKGVDYEAAQGTPIIAAADGIIEEIGYSRGTGYGNYLRIRHTTRLETAYAHMLGFAPRLRTGSFVRRGQIIGYVGQTGVATGPHLYFEILVDNLQIDPESAPLRWTRPRFNSQMAAVPGP